MLFFHLAVLADEADPYKCPIKFDFTYACPSTKQPGRKLVCIHESWLCDQEVDCPDGEDEATGVGMPCHNRNCKYLNISQCFSRSSRGC